VEAIRIARLLHDTLEESNALETKAKALNSLDRHKKSLEAAEASLKIARAAGNKRGEEMALETKAKTMRILRRREDRTSP
jgi:uncharacterized protein YifE (UPF0438 family)